MKQKLLKTWLVMLCMLVGIGSAWAAEITFTPGTDKSSNTSITKDGITLTATTFNNDSYYQAYSGTPLKVESTVGNITKIEITCIGSGTSNYGPSKFSKASVGSYNYSGNVGTWTGNASEISLSTSGQVRMTKVVVTTASSSTPTYALTFANNSSGTFSATVDGKSVTSGSKVETGKTVTLTATPKDGYVFNTWNVYKTANQYNYVTVSKNNTFTMPSEAVTVDAYFIEGKTIPNAQVSVAAGTYRGAQSVTITNLDEDEYSYYYTLDGTTPAIDEGMNPVGTTQEYNGAINISESCTLSILTTDLTDSKVNTFEYVIEVPYTVTIEAPVNGTLKVMAGETEVKSGDKFYKGDVITATATPAEGYKFRNVQFTDASAHTFTASNVKEWTMGDHDVTISAAFDIIPTYTVSFHANGNVLQTQIYEENETVTIPTVDDINNYKFVGWTTASTVFKDTAPEFVTPSTTATATADYYAVFATEVSGGQGASQNASLSIASYASANKWNNDTQYTSATIVENVLTATVSGGANTGKYYSNDNTWRVYQNETGTMTVTAAEGYELESITVTYGVKNTGKMLFGENPTESGAKVTVSGLSATFGVGNTTTATNGQIQIKNIEVEYHALSGINYSNYCLIVPAPFTVTTADTDFYSLYLNYAVTIPENVTAYTGKLNGSSLNLTKIEGGVIPAKTGVVFKTPESAGKAEFMPCADVDPFKDNDIQGVAQVTPIDAINTTGTILVLGMVNGKVGFALPAESATTLAANKAYIIVDPAAAAKGVTFVVDEATAINSVNTEINNSAVYNLAGQRVNANTKGIVIVNGKKMLNK